MLILALKTDSTNAELSLYKDNKVIDHLSFKAERSLADKIHLFIKELLEKNQFELTDLKGLIVYQGPGSFTGLRIGLSVANALAYSLKIPICTAAHENWPEHALNQILSGQDEKQIVPFYGAEPNITMPRK